MIATESVACADQRGDSPAGPMTGRVAALAYRAEGVAAERAEAFAVPTMRSVVEWRKRLPALSSRLAIVGRKPRAEMPGRAARNR